MIVITGKPRSRTSMMTRCIHLAGVPLAFTEMKRKPEMKEQFRNPYGFFEGAWNGKDGVIKSLACVNWDKFPNPRFIYMEREDEKIKSSWKDIASKKNKLFKKPSKEKLAEIRQKVQEMKKNKNRPKPKPIVPAEEAVKDYPHIVVNADKFVLDPEFYRKDFERLFPELDFDLIKSGIDKELYINR
jgi:hypothetical protein